MALLKPIAWFAAGGIGGAFGAALLLEGDGAPADTAPSLIETVTGLSLGRNDGSRAGAEPGIAERLEVYGDAQQQTNVEALARALERASTRSWSPARDLEIDALLGRLAEIAPDYAAEVAAALELETPFLALAWLAWAEADPDAAIAGLAQIRDGMARREVALALTDVIGDDGRSVARIAAALAPAERDALRVDWIAQLAAADPFGAFREATAISEPALQRRALQGVVVAWTAQDPYGALAQADLLPPDLARVFRSGVFTEWARSDPDGYIAYIESAADLPQEATSGIQYLLAADPALIERIAGNFPDALGRSIRASALNALAQSDPASARVQAEALPPGQDRDLALQAVATALAEADPEAALAWVRSLSPPAPNALRSVTLSLAREDPRSLFAMLDDPTSGVDPQLLLAAATSLSSADPAHLPQLADGLLARNDIQSAQALQRFVGNWMQRDPETALDWVLAHGTEVDANVLASAAQTLAARDPVAAAGYVNRLPPEQRGAWITQVASQYGRYDPYGAMAWVGQFQGQETYEVALRELISSAAQSDPRAAAQMLAQSSGTVQLGAAQQVAAALAQQDPREAARWAVTLSDTRARASAATVVAGAWYGSDPSAARRWALAQPEGVERDQVLDSLVMRAAAAGDFDREILNGYGSDSRSQQATANAITMLARNDPARARELTESEIASPTERARLDGLIVQAERIGQRLPAGGGF